MAIKFSCRRCGTHFKVSDGLAGKSARCKKCGNRLRVPEAAPQLASVAASGVFRMGAVQADQPTPEETAPPGSNARGPSSAPSSLRLAPIPSLDDLKPVVRKQAQRWDDEDSIEYEVEQPITRPVTTAPRRVPPSRSRLFWGRGGIAEVLLLGLRKISDLAYLVSIPFLLLILLGIILKQHQLAIIAAVIVVLINIVRLGIDGFVLVALAFKNGPLQGVLFFVPPFTFYYLSKRKVMQEAMRRFLGPALPIVGVVLLFAFVPWLRGGDDGADVSLDVRVPAVQESQDP